MTDAVASAPPAPPSPASRAPHPVVWTILYLPFGAFGGFIGVALTFLATRHGMSITEGALLQGASLLTAWLKWSWAPVVDVTLSPKRWYVLATLASALGVATMSAMPLSPETLWVLLAVIAAGSLINSMVGMSIEAIMASVTTAEDQGRVSAWFQAGNLGGYGVGGGLGLLLLQHLPEPWMAGAVLGGLFLLCCLALVPLPDVISPHAGKPVRDAVFGVLGDIRDMMRTRAGRLSALLCALPLGTGAAQGVLAQAEVAAKWGAGENEVALMQGFLAGIITTVGCFVGGWLCVRFPPRSAYSGIGVGLAVVAVGMAVSPLTVPMYLLWNVVYSFGVGLAYSAFTAVVLSAIGTSSAATKYNLFASLSNFPIWWLGLLLGAVADDLGAPAMLATEASLGLVAVVVFIQANRWLRPEPPAAPAAA